MFLDQAASDSINLNVGIVPVLVTVRLTNYLHLAKVSMGLVSMEEDIVARMMAKGDLETGQAASLPRLVRNTI